MAFTLPPYTHPDFSHPRFQHCPVAVFAPAPSDGVAPEGYHATSVFPEYVQMTRGDWRLLTESRMDGVIVRDPDGRLWVREFRNIAAGDSVLVGRGEDGEDGIFVHVDGFSFPPRVTEKFVFRSRLTRETSFSIDYDELYELLHHEREHGHITWVLGPAVVFDRDAREAFVSLVEDGYVHALLAGNALATHDLEGAMFGTALGQELYSKRSVPLGHYHHLDTLNRIRAMGSIEAAIGGGLILNGVMRAITNRNIPFVLAGSIRDDGPLPEVTADTYQAQERMRAITRKSTTVVAMATQLHSIATGNLTPSYQVMADGTVRPVYFHAVDMSEFTINKLANRGSVTARSILTNVQDFVVTVARGLKERTC